MRDVLESLKGSNQHELVFICLGVGGPEEVLGNGRIIYAGKEKDVQRMVLYYRASDVYLHAASAEAFGKMITEANACGVPVVATNIGGIPEQIIDGETGYLIPPGSINQMTAAVQKIIDDPSFAAALRDGRHARMLVPVLVSSDRWTNF
jgi:glycosyltransferase involved in cell wall biosynthesis